MILGRIDNVDDERQITDKKLTTGAVFIDLSVAYDTVQHRSLIHKLYTITNDTGLCLVNRILLENRIFYDNLNGQSR